MSSFEIIGGKELSGTIAPQGSKNESLQIICATLLTSKKVRLKNIPEIIDVLNLINLLKIIGVKVKKNSANDFTFQANNINKEYFKEPKFKEFGSKIRGSVMIMGALLSRFGEAYIVKPGGDKIGRRPLDTHFNAFKMTGVQVKEKNNLYQLKSNKILKKIKITLEEASVTGTANLVMGSVLKKNTQTSIYNAACEPYIQQLCTMLNKMGAKITGIGTNLISIEGTNELNGCEHTALPDMIEIGSWIGLAAMTQSNLIIKNASIKNLGVILDVFKKIGVKIKTKKDDIIIQKQKSLDVSTLMNGSVLTISDAPWPGFTPDLISIILVVATQANGSVLIHQKMFESRLFFVDKLIDMGAKIILCDPHRATVVGLNRSHQLKGTVMSSPDIRAGIALLIAALSAKGKSTIHNVNQIDRGYENIVKRLRKIGANIVRKR